MDSTFIGRIAKVVEGPTPLTQSIGVVRVEAAGVVWGAVVALAESVKLGDFVTVYGEDKQIYNHTNGFYTFVRIAEPLRIRGR